MPKLPNCYLFFELRTGNYLCIHNCPVPNLCIYRLALLRLVVSMFGEECALWNSLSCNFHLTVTFSFSFQRIFSLWVFIGHIQSTHLFIPQLGWEMKSTLSGS